MELAAIGAPNRSMTAAYAGCLRFYTAGDTRISAAVLPERGKYGIMKFNLLTKEHILKVLLTGASGFVGQATLKALTATGAEVVTLGRRPVAGYRHIPCDLLSGPDFHALLGQAQATHLLHLAWATEHGKFWATPENLEWITATLSLVTAFCESGGRGIVCAGSCAEYDWSSGWCDEETTSTNAATLYGRAKDATRRVAQSVAQQADVPLAWGRVFLSYGHGEDARRLIPSATAALLGKTAAFSIDGAAQRDFLHVSDVAEAFVALLGSGANGVANISTGRPVALSQAIERLAVPLGGDPAAFLALAAPRAGEPRLLSGAPAHLARLGWSPKLSLDEGFGKLAAQMAK